MFLHSLQINSVSQHGVVVRYVTARRLLIIIFWQVDALANAWNLNYAL